APLGPYTTLFRSRPLSRRQVQRAVERHGERTGGHGTAGHGDTLPAADLALETGRSRVQPCVNAVCVYAELHHQVGQCRHRWTSSACRAAASRSRPAASPSSAACPERRTRSGSAWPSPAAPAATALLWPSDPTGSGGPRTSDASPASCAGQPHPSPGGRRACQTSPGRAARSAARTPPCGPARCRRSAPVPRAGASGTPPPGGAGDAAPAASGIALGLLDLLVERLVQARQLVDQQEQPVDGARALLGQVPGLAVLEDPLTRLRVVEALHHDLGLAVPEGDLYRVVPVLAGLGAHGQGPCLVLPELGVVERLHTDGDAAPLGDRDVLVLDVLGTEDDFGQRLHVDSLLRIYATDRYIHRTVSYRHPRSPACR